MVTINMIVFGMVVIVVGTMSKKNIAIFVNAKPVNFQNFGRMDSAMMVIITLDANLMEEIVAVQM